MKFLRLFVMVLVFPAAVFAANSKVTFVTNLGNIEIELFDDQAPVTAKNFLTYVDSKFFEGTIFHRVIPDFVAQGGGLDKDMVEKPTLDPIINESKNGVSNLRGTLGMARTSEPNSATSQFYINLKDNVFLDYRDESRVGYAVFGKVVAGMEVVDKMATMPTTTVGEYEDVPVEPIIVLEVRKQ